MQHDLDIFCGVVDHLFHLDLALFAGFNDGLDQRGSCRTEGYLFDNQSLFIDNLDLSPDLDLAAAIALASHVTRFFAPLPRQSCPVHRCWRTRAVSYAQASRVARADGARAWQAIHARLSRGFVVDGGGAAAGQSFAGAGVVGDQGEGGARGGGDSAGDGGVGAGVDRRRCDAPGGVRPADGRSVSRRVRAARGAAVRGVEGSVSRAAGAAAAGLSGEADGRGAPDRRFRDGGASRGAAAGSRSAGRGGDTWGDGGARVGERSWRRAEGVCAVRGASAGGAGREAGARSRADGGSAARRAALAEPAGGLGRK